MNCFQLKRLSALLICIIKNRYGRSDSSEVVFPAKQRELDWDTIKLHTKTSRFQRFSKKGENRFVKQGD